MRKESSWAGYIEQGEYIRDVSVAQLHDAHSHGQYTRHTTRFRNNIYYSQDVVKI